MNSVMIAGLLSLVIANGNAAPEQTAVESGTPPASSGTSFLVNRYREKDQQRPSVARALDGSFVVAWDSDGEDGSVDGVYARRYDAQGVPRGDEFLVNVNTRNRQYAPRVAIDGSGGFVVVWLSNSQDALGLEIYARRYDASGAALGGEFRVDTSGRPAYSQFDVAMTSDGRFVITWIDRIGILGVSALKQQTLNAQRYNSDGSPMGPVIMVYQTDLFAVRTPSVAVDGAGEFIVAWFIGPGSIWARRFDADGQAQGISFRVSQVNSQVVVDRPQIARSASGQFAIAWETSGTDDLADTGVYLRQYSADGAALGAAARADAHLLRTPEIAVSGNHFVVTAQSDAIYAQCVEASGALKPAFRVDDSPTLYTPLFASVGSDGSGNLVFTWQNLMSGDGMGRDVQARLFGPC